MNEPESHDLARELKEAAPWMESAAMTALVFDGAPAERYVGVTLDESTEMVVEHNEDDWNIFVAQLEDGTYLGTDILFPDLPADASIPQVANKVLDRARMFYRRDLTAKPGAADTSEEARLLGEILAKRGA